MNWSTETQTSSFTTNQYVDNAISKRQRTASAGENVRSSYDVVGINAAEVPNMKTAIADYVNRIKSYLEKINEDAEAAKAFKGDEIAASVRKYIASEKEYCTDLVSNLLAFSDRLQDVYDAWNKAASNMSSGINTAAASLGGQSTEYKATK